MSDLQLEMLRMHPAWIGQRKGTPTWWRVGDQHLLRWDCRVGNDCRIRIVRAWSKSGQLFPEHNSLVFLYPAPAAGTQEDAIKKCSHTNAKIGRYSRGGELCDVRDVSGAWWHIKNNKPDRLWRVRELETLSMLKITIKTRICNNLSFGSDWKFIGYSVSRTRMVQF